MNVYIAAALCEMERAKEAAETIRHRGIGVASTWHDGGDDTPECDVGLLDRVGISLKNHSDLASANALVLLAHPAGRGSLVEAAIAHTRKLPIVIVGHWRDVTLMLLFSEVQFADHISQAIDMLSQRVG